MCNLQQLKTAVFTYRSPHFSPGDAPEAITLNVVWMEREFDAYKVSRSMYPSIFNSFPVIRTGSAKIAVFKYRSPHFSPEDVPATITQYAAWVERQFNACQFAKPLAACTYLSSIVSELYDA